MHMEQYYWTVVILVWMSDATRVRHPNGGNVTSYGAR